jgi:hypothetical protein
MTTAQPTKTPRFILRGTDPDTKKHYFVQDIASPMRLEETEIMEEARDFGSLVNARFFSWDFSLEDHWYKWVIVEWIAGQKRYKVHPVPKQQPECDEADDEDLDGPDDDDA